MAVYTNFIFRGILWLRDILWYNRHMFWYRLLSFDVGDMEKWRDFNASAFTQRKLLKVYTCLDDNSRTIIGLPKFETRTHIYARANYPEVAIHPAQMTSVALNHSVARRPKAYGGDIYNFWSRV